jgi:type I restriction enzyme S subunit
MKKDKHGWQVKSLGEVAEVFNGKTPSKSEKRKSGVSILKIKDITDEGRFIGEFDSFVDDIFYQRNKDKLLHVKDILVLNAAHNSAYVGSKTCFVKDEFANSLATGEWMVIRGNDQLVDSYYLYSFVRSSKGKNEIKNIVKGIHLYPKDVKRIQTPLPPLPIQKQIAEILEKADQAKQKRKEANKLTDEFLQSVFIEMFGDPVKNPKGWEVKTVEEISIPERSAIKCGPFGSQLLLEELRNEGIPVYGIDNVLKNEFVWAKSKYITENKFKELKAFSIKPNDVLISRTGTVGRACLAPKNIPKSIIGPNLLKVTIDYKHMLPLILSFAINYSSSIIEEIKQMSPGATVPVFNTTNLRKLKILVPPLSLQQQFAEIVNKTEALKEKQKESEKELDNLFNSLMQKAFKGELV